MLLSAATPAAACAVRGSQRAVLRRTAAAVSLQRRWAPTQPEEEARRIDGYAREEEEEARRTERSDTFAKRMATVHGSTNKGAGAGDTPVTQGIGPAARLAAGAQAKVAKAADRWGIRWNREQRKTEGETEEPEGLTPDDVAEHYQQAARAMLSEVVPKIRVERQEQERLRGEAEVQSKQLAERERRRFAFEILRICDDLAVLKLDDSEDAPVGMRTVSQGVNITQAHLIRTLERHGVKQHEVSKGDKYNGAIHAQESLWKYDPSNRKPINIRAFPSHDQCPTGKQLMPDEEFAVSTMHEDPELLETQSQQCAKFLRLSAGGWVFMAKPGPNGPQRMCRPADVQLKDPGPQDTVEKVILPAYTYRGELLRKATVRLTRPDSSKLWI